MEDFGARLPKTDDLPGKKAGYAILFISMALYVISLSQKCFCTEKDCGETGEGLALLISGIFGFGCKGWFAWLANPLLILSWIFFNRKRSVSLLLSLAAVIFCFLFLLVDEIVINEAGHTSPIESYEIGYWLWVSSILVLFAGNLVRYFIEKRTPIA